MFPLSFTPFTLIQAFPQEAVCFAALFPLLALSASARAGRNISFLVLLSASLLAAFLPSLDFYSAYIASGASGAKRAFCIVFAAFLVLDATCFRSSKDALVLFALSLIGALMMLSSSDWFMFFLSAEALSLSSCCLIGLGRSRRSLEAALKYFAAGALASCFLLLGATVLFIAFGQASFSSFPGWYHPAVCGSLLLSSFMLLKTGCAPFQYWVSDVYEGSPLSVTVFLAVVSKLAFFFALSRTLFGPLSEVASLWTPALSFCAALSIVVGCLGALFQKRVKRLLAYSSINNAGYVLAAFSTGSFSGLQAGLAYLLLYLATLLVLFGFLSGARGSVALASVNELGLMRDSAGASVLVSGLLFSLAGIPPLTGFWTKFFVLSELVSLKMYMLATVAAFASVLSSYYYVSLVRILHFEEPSVRPFNKTYSAPFSGLWLPLLSAPVLVYPLFPDIVHTTTRDIALGVFLGVY